MGAKICRRAVAGSEPVIGWKEDMNSQNIEEERKEGGQDNGLYNRVLVVFVQLRVYSGVRRIVMYISSFCR